MAPALFKSGATITGFDGRKNEFLFLSQAYDHVWHKNLQANSLEKFEAFLRETSPDVIHFHHYLTYGLEYIKAARNYLDAAGGRLVFTFHEFVSICPALGQMVRTADKSLCEKASSVRCHQCFPEFTPEHFSMRRMWIKHHLDLVDVFVAPSAFLRDRYVDWGIPENKIIHIANGHQPMLPELPISRRPDIHEQRRSRFAFFGQFVDNKGLLVLFDAVRLLRKRGFDDFTLDVYGSNLDFASDAFKRDFEKFWTGESAAGNDGQRLRLRGSYEISQIPRFMAVTDWVVVPSTWWEIFGMVVSEAFMFGKPVICSNIGGIAERVCHDVDGLQFVVGSSESLADAMERALTEEGLWERLHKNVRQPPTAAIVARQHIELCYSPMVQ